LLKASNASALHEKELKKLEILAKIYQLIQGVKTPEDIPDELKNASTMLSSKPYTQDQVKTALWLRGELRWKQYRPQLEIHDTILRTKVRKVVAKCSRRLGKSFALMAYAISRAVKNPYSRIPFAAPTNKDLKTSLSP
jgi:hypothetical protein